jgi:hypothetical protein
VVKVLYPQRKNEKPTISIFACIQPFSRCPKCTLFPPCPHLSEEQLGGWVGHGVRWAYSTPLQSKDKRLSPPLAASHPKPPIRPCAVERALKRRKEYPKYRDALVCGSFSKTGACKIVNGGKHCSLDHPANMHSIR